MSEGRLACWCQQVHKATCLLAPSLLAFSQDFWRKFMHLYKLFCGWGLVGMYEVCCNCCQDGHACSSNSHSCNHAWCCQLYEFACFVQSNFSFSGQSNNYDESACAFLPAEACLIMFDFKSHLLVWQSLHSHTEHVQLHAWLQSCDSSSLPTSCLCCFYWLASLVGLL